jgi:hypothetical protein
LTKRAFALILKVVRKGGIEMNACIFILTINAVMPVYVGPGGSQIDHLGIGDQVCVTRIEPGDLMQVHWSSGNIGHTGFLHGINVKQPAQPTEPMEREEQYDTPSIPPATSPMPDETPQNRSLYRSPEPAPTTTHASLVMQCFPQGGAPYSVVYANGRAAVISNSGITREYDVIDEHDNQGGYTFYVAAKRDDQERTLYFAFDYSHRTDVSAIRVKASNYDSRDKCAMDWGNTK